MTAIQPYTQEYLDELRQAHADFVQAVAPAEVERKAAFHAFCDSYEDPDDIDWDDSRHLALWDRYHARTATTRKVYNNRIAAAEVKFREGRVAVMGR